MKALVVYYSKSGNTKAVAELIAGAASADLESLVEVGVSRKGLLGYLSAGRGGMFKKKSKIQAPSKAPNDYDIVFVGTPIWGWNLPLLSAATLGRPISGQHLLHSSAQWAEVDTKRRSLR